MEQYEEWEDEDGNIIRKCPVHNYYVSPSINQSNYIQERMFSPNYEKICISPRPKDQYNNYIITTSNQDMIDDYEHQQYSFENNQNLKYTNQYHKQSVYNDNYNMNNINNTNIVSTNVNSSLSKYESSDGILRGYTNNYSFYVSGSSQIKPKVTVCNQYNNKGSISNSNNDSNYQKKNYYQNKRQIIYNNSGQMQKNPGHYQKVIYSNNNKNTNNNKNYGNRQIIQNDNSSYVIRTVESEPMIYTPSNPQYINNNYYIKYNNNEGEDKIYYINENENSNALQQKNYQRPLVQRRMVKRVFDKEPSGSRKNHYIIGQNNNQRNINKKIQINNNNDQQKTVYQKVSNYNNINKRNNYFSQYPLKRPNTPNIIRQNLPSNANSYLPMISRQQKMMAYSPNFYDPKNLNNSESYPKRGNIYAYTENNEYFFNKTEANSPRASTLFIAKSPLMNIDKNIYIYPTRKEREYNSRTELQNQPEYELEYENEENDEDDNVYEVPEMFNDHRVVLYEDRRQNNPDRPFLRESNYSQSKRNGKKYGVYTQTLAMNMNNNYEDEYEIDRRNVRNVRRYNNRNNYSVPKTMRPINYSKNFVKQNREYTAFERSLKNIRDNEEEIEIENEERNRRIRIKTNGSNNHRLYISKNSKGKPSRKYKTYTELQSDRPQEYVLQDIDDDDSQDEYYIPPNINRNKNIIKNDNFRFLPQEEGNRYQSNPPIYHPEEEKNYYEEENMDNYQNVNTQTQNEENVEEDNYDEVEQIYVPNKLITAREDNFRIIQNNERNRRKEFNQKQFIQNSQNSDENEQMQDNEIERKEHLEEIIQPTNINTNIEEDLYQREDSPKDCDDNIQEENKNLKNIQTKINEKYYDNQGNYLGEKKIITKKKVQANNQNNQREEGEYQDEQDEQEDDEENENEYTPYQSNHKKFKKRGENNKNIIESKYHSYFGDSNNNVYYEIKGVSGEVNKEEESKNNEEIVEKRKYKDPLVQVKNLNFGIQSENLCVPAQDNDNNNLDEEKDKIDDKGNNDEKEADEQQIGENAEIDEEEEEENNINENKENEEKYKNYEEERNINDKGNTNENEQINANKDIYKIYNKNENNYLDENNNGKDINENIDFNQEDNKINQYNDILNEGLANENNIEENIDMENKEINNNEELEKNNNNIQYEEKIININNQNNHYENNEKNDGKNLKKNNFECNEIEQIVEENEAEEIENQNIQKDEEEEIENQNIQKDEMEEDIGEGLVDIEDNNNYEDNGIGEGDEGFEGFEEQKEENNENYIEEENINSVEYEK